jgi:hypothetical protein
LILVGFFGVLARAPFFAHRYCAMAAASATMVVMGTRPMNTNIMRRRVVDRRSSILRVTANLLLFAASSLAALSYLSKTSTSKAWPALVSSEHHRGSSCLRSH